MNNRHVVLFGVGFIVGYFLIKFKTKSPITKSDNQVFKDTSSQTEPPKVLGGEIDESVEEKKTEEVIDPRIERCKEKWLKFSSTVKFTSQEQMQKTYDNYMTTCVAQS
jgi:hypothetical protein